MMSLKCPSARRMTYLLPLIAVAVLAVGCSSDDTNTTNTGTTPSTATTTDTFSGTLTLNGAQTFPFTIGGSGTISAQLVTLAYADSTNTAAVVPIGMAVGTFNTTTSLCQVILSNDAAVPTATIPGTATTLGNFCLRIYDATGKVTQPENFVVNVAHP